MKCLVELRLSKEEKPREEQLFNYQPFVLFVFHVIERKPSDMDIFFKFYS